MRNYGHFFTTANKPIPELVFVAGDCSPRRYHRFWEANQSYILMDAPPPEDVQSFYALSECLRGLGLAAPTVIEKDMTQGYLVLEDFGDFTFTRYLEAGRDPVLAYELALDVLIYLHQQTERPLPLPDYTVILLLKEIEIGLDWYWPQAQKSPLETSQRKDFLALWTEVFTASLNTPHRLVLRDYHVDNLMWLERREGLQRCGLLDFQDALWGPKVFDIVSLLHDARRDVPEEMRHHLWQRYWQAFPEDDVPALLQSAAILSAGRLFKILGIFMRMHILHGNPNYLVHIPRVWTLLWECLAHPSLKALQNFLQRYFHAN